MTEVLGFGSPATADQSDGGQWYTLGCVFSSTVAGLVTGARWRAPTNSPGGQCRVVLYRQSDQVKVAESDLFTAANGVDNNASFVTPFSIAAGTNYVVGAVTDRYAFTNGGWPFTSTPGSYMTAAAGSGTTANGRFGTTTSGVSVYPGTASGAAANFFVGPLFEPYVLTLTGATTPTGALSKTVIRSVGGTVTPTAVLTRQTQKSLVGAITPAGSLAKVVQMNFAGTASPAGTLLKLLSRLLGGTVTPQGTVTSFHGRPADWSAGAPKRKWRAGPPGGGG